MPLFSYCCGINTPQYASLTQYNKAIDGPGRYYQYPPEPDQTEQRKLLDMATQKHTPRPPQAIKDALWQIRQQRDSEQAARHDTLRAEHYAATDALYALGAFTRQVIAPCFVVYTYKGQASSAEATVVFIAQTGEYVVATNDTRFTSEELIDGVLAARQMAKERGTKAVQA